MKKVEIWTRFLRVTPIELSEVQLIEQAKLFDTPIDEYKKAYEQLKYLMISLWKNNVYQVAIKKVTNQPKNWPSLLHLSIKRLDQQPIHDWRDLQKIKNELIGPEHEALEIYPAESRLVDTANQYHLWVFKESGIHIPIGFLEGKKNAKSGGGSRQRPF